MKATRKPGSMLRVSDKLSDSLWDLKSVICLDEGVSGRFSVLPKLHKLTMLFISVDMSVHVCFQGKIELYSLFIEVLLYSKDMDSPMAR